VKRTIIKLALVGLMVWVSMTTLSWANQAETESDFTELSIEDLMNLEVTTVSKKAQKLSDTAAAVFVITQSDIQRSGATSIPEALRMAPGVEVARIDASKWAVTVRGFNGRFANKLLVLMDGRTLYTPTFSGVFWHMQDTLLEDIDRIEVIRGPGASLWGANAVNGVINIITKKAGDSQGTYLSAGGGTEERVFAAARYGGHLDKDLSYRMYAKYFDRDNAVDAAGDETADHWDGLRGGFRMDWEATGHDTMTLQGDIFDGEDGETLTTASLDPPYSITSDKENGSFGGNLLGRWMHRFSNTSETVLQLYYDGLERTSEILDVYQNTFDIDFQHRFQLGTRNQMMWGFGYRFVRDDFNNSFSTSIIPDSRDLNLVSAFVQDEIKLIPDRLDLILGSKFEHNDFTGFEAQPSGRLVWKPAEKQTLWGAISRAVRTPSRGEHDTYVNTRVIPPDALFPGSPAQPVTLVGNRDFDSETLIAYELGYRIQPTRRLSLDVATFYNVYDNLRTVEPTSMFSATAGNEMEGDTYGIELAADFQPLDWWRLQLSYSFLEMNLSLKDTSMDTISVGAEGESPQNKVSVRSMMDLPHNLELDIWFRYVDNLPTQQVDDYTTLDVRFAWKPLKWLELAVVGQSLLDDHHPEFKPELIDTSPTEVERSVYGKITCRF
jgi:iron complex outermembrane recepter protein